MYQILLQLFCCFSVYVTSFGENNVENFDDNYYYSLGLYRHFQSSGDFMNTLPVLAKNAYLKDLRKELLTSLIETVSFNSSKCLRDILYTFQSVTASSNQWSWRFLDSFAKPPESGILQGNFKWVGDYNECVKVYAPPQMSNSATGDFNGQYCTLEYNVSLLNKSFPLEIGICLPDSCSPKDLQKEIIDFIFKAGGYDVPVETSVTNVSVSIICSPRERRLSFAAKSVIGLISIFCTLALAGSTITAVKFFKNLIHKQKRTSLIVHVIDQEPVVADQHDILNKNLQSNDVLLLQNNGFNRFLNNCTDLLSCFCVFTNGAKLLNTHSTNEELLCIHGIRFLSMSWVILGHTYSFSTKVISNLLDAAEDLNNFFFQVVLQGAFSVDSFFVLSGFLLTYSFMKGCSKSRGSVSWLNFYIHRFIRLTPIYMILLGFSASVYFYLGSGPFWPLDDFDSKCVKNWWWNLLYINNFLGTKQLCMGYTWYLANDMQFFVISPIFLISLLRWPKIGFCLLGLFLLASLSASFYITYHFDLFIGLVGIDVTNIDMNDVNQLLSKYTDYFFKLYIKPYGRIGPYLVGIIVGYVFFKHKTSNKRNLRWVYLCFGWIVASVTTLSCVYGLYKANPSLIARCLYNASSRTCFGLGLSWVIYVCLTHQSGIINDILSIKLFMPLSRLTYSAYLIHPMIINGYYAALKKPLEFSHPTMVLLFLSFMTVTYAIALPVSLILESPIVSLEKVIKSKFNRRQNTDSVN